MATKLTDGFVLEPVRVAPSNSQNTAPPENGVLRDCKPLPSSYDAVEPTKVFDVDGSQYRVATFGLDGAQEYLVWAANASNLAVIEDPTWAFNGGRGTIPTGTLTVTDGAGEREDGSQRVIILDTQGRTLADVLQFDVVRGDTGATTTLTKGVDYAVVDPSSGVVRLFDTISNRNAFGSAPAALSTLRGDRIENISIVLAELKFWWTKNEPGVERFAWSDAEQRWKPLKGAAVATAGVLNGGTTQLSPPMTDLVEGSYVPGSSQADQFARVRVGDTPDETSTPIGEDAGAPFNGLYVVPDDDIVDAFNFAAFSPEPAGVISVTTSVIQWNPAFVTANLGSSIFYFTPVFSEDSTGDLGFMEDATTVPVHISPAPDMQTSPLIRLGSRRYLSVVVFTNEAEMAAATAPVSGQVYAAMSTGQLRFADTDLNQSVPGNPAFDVAFYREKIFYDGVTLNRVPQPPRAPVQLVDSSYNPVVVGASNSLYVPESEPLPGLGVSGILDIPDGTGVEPEPGTGSVRVGGDTTNPVDFTGKLRQVSTLGDAVIFARGRALKTLRVVDLTSEIPTNAFEIPSGTAFVARQGQFITGGDGSLVGLGRQDRSALDGEALYFRQAVFKPSYYTEQARLVSVRTGPFEFDTTHLFYFQVDGTPFVWNSGSLGAPGIYSATQVAASIDAAMSTGQCYTLNNRLVIEADDPDSGTVEVQFGASANSYDLTANRILGFLPGWRVDTADPDTYWLSDTGSSIGFYRTPRNRDMSEDYPDALDVQFVDDEILVDGTTQIPYVPLVRPPLRDLAGYDQDVFFRTASGRSTRYLNLYQEVAYDFDNPDVKRFLWLESGSLLQAFDRPATSVYLGNQNVLSASFLAEVGGDLSLAETVGPFVAQTQGTDFLLDREGVTGVVNFIDSRGGEVSTGVGASFTSGSGLFTDTTVDFVAAGVSAGDLLRVDSGSLDGLYFVVQGVNSATSLTVSPSFPVSSTDPVTWSIFEGFEADVYDPAVRADIVYDAFNHLTSEPFEIRLLSSTGTVPVDAAAQSATRSTAFVFDALQIGRISTFRFGLEGPETLITFLNAAKLGPLASTGLFVPDQGSTRFVDGAFSILLAGRAFTHGVDLVPVAAFTPTIPSGTVEYLTGTGELGFADDVLTAYDGSSVVYREEFLTPGVMAANDVEADPETGELNFSSADLAAYGGSTTGYFVEQMVTEGRSEVALSPITGSFGFLRPLRNGQIVEATYTLADTNGDQLRDGDGNPTSVTEFLSVYVRNEVATRVDGQIYSFNPTNRTVSDDRIVVYVGVERQNYGGVNSVRPDPDQNRVLFSLLVPDSETVKVSYGVLEAFGGETAYTTSRRPVYRPPFFIPAEANTFILTGDRSADLEPGKMLRLGDQLLYLKSVSYSASAGTTTVGITPASERERGSRAPGNDLLSLITSYPVAGDVDGVTVTKAFDGLLLTVGAAFEPVRKGSKEIKLAGDVTQFGVAGHFLEIDGDPYLVTGSRLSSDGFFTTLGVAVPFEREYSNTSTLKMSVRPVYPVGASTLLGTDPVLVSEPFELVKFTYDSDGDLTAPGEILAPGVDYDLDPDSGQIRLQEGVQAFERFVFRYVKTKFLAPVQSGQFVLTPRVRASYLFNTLPDNRNGYLGVTVYARYRFRNPDSFYFSVTPLADVLGEVAEDVIASTVEASRSGSGFSGALTTPTNRIRGALPSRTRLQQLEIQDRVARVFLELYNASVTSFEQMLENMDGRFIGDRDGKFLFFVGRGEDFTPPGFEDDVSGVLNPRNVWSEVFQGAQGLSYPLAFQDTDNLVEPSSASLDADLVLTGSLLSQNQFRNLVDTQKRRIRNMIDDVVLVGREPVKRTFVGFPFSVNVVSRGIFDRMGDYHYLSRLFPQTFTVFLTTNPGVDADFTTQDFGYYTFSRQIGDGSRVSTSGEPIGQLANGVLDRVTNVASLLLGDRFARAHIVRVEPDGYDSFEAATAGRFTVILSMLPLTEFPLDANNDPDVSRLISQSGSGDLIDIETGNPDLSIPAFRSRILPSGGSFLSQNPQRLALGKPDGTIYPLSFVGASVPLGSSSGLAGVYVDQVYQGSVITLRGADGASGEITSPAEIVTVDSTGAIQPVEFEPGDTLFVIPDDRSTEVPTTAEEAGPLQSQYRIGYDVGLNSTTGELLDITQPSSADPSTFPLKELLGQNPPEPLSDLEGLAIVQNTRIDPFTAIPALQGRDLNDSGDRTIPYLYSADTEQIALRNLEVGYRGVLADTPVPSAVYPEEIYATDGVMWNAERGGEPPAVLISTEDPFPVNGPYVPNSGIGDLRSYDVILMQKGQGGLPDGVEGILTVGDVRWTGSQAYIEQPRFVTETRTGDRIRYILNRAAAHVGGGTTGVTVEENGGNTIFDFSTCGLTTDDGQASGSGGFNTIFNNTLLAFPNENRFILQIYNTSTGALLETVSLTGDPTGALGPVGGRATGGLGTATHGTTATCAGNTVTVPATGFVSFAALGGAAPGPLGPFDFTISLDTATAGPSTTTNFVGTDTGRIQPDRLTFEEVFDLSLAKAEGTVNPGAVNFETNLDVATVTSPVTDNLTVNSAAEVNGGLEITFLTDGSGDTGAFTAATSGGAGDESGTLRVPSFRGFLNTPVGDQSDLIFSLLPSSDQDENGVICAGEGYCNGSDTNLDNRVTGIQVSTGALANVNKGDLLVIKSAADGTAPTFAGATATTKAGTYLIRRVVESDDVVTHPETRQLVLTSTAGSGGGWVRVRFPTVTAFDQGAATLTVSDLAGTPDASVMPTPTGHGFPASGRVYIVRDVSLLGAATFAEFRNAVMSANYTSISGTTFLGLSTFQDAGGIALSAGDFFAALSEGQQVSGMVYLYVDPVGQQGLPDSNTVGWDEPLVSVFGFAGISIDSSPVVTGTTVSTLEFDTSSDDIRKPATSEASRLTVDERNYTANVYSSDRDFPVYPSTPGLLDIGELNASQWDDLHRPVAFGSSDLACLLPGEILKTSTAATTEGFRATSGIFLEPTWPRPVLDLDSGSPLVVDASTALGVSSTGLRDLSDFSTITDPEDVSFEIRRIRRFNFFVDEALRQLRSVYEIRRGTVLTNTNSGPGMETVTSVGTQFGGFTSALGRVRAGDVFRLLDADGVVITAREILEVVSDTELLLRSPGLPDASYAGNRFEIYLKSAPVPHEQSAEELFDLFTERVVFTSIRDFSTNDGGYVQFNFDYANDTNILRDTTVDGVATTYEASGVQVGDYLVVDPAGELSVPGAPTPTPRGVYARGDVSVPARAGVHASGGPDVLDDNRGFYRVTDVSPDTLTVSGASEWAGDLTSGDVIFEAGSGNDWALYPVVTGSLIGPAGVEGQNDLRPTNYAAGGVFSGQNTSIAPFSYRIARPVSNIRVETYEFVLMIRERILSMIDFINSGIEAGSTYQEFQDQEHILDVLLGVISAEDFAAVMGRVETAPFANSATSLAVLDRRFWIRDFQLDRETPRGSVTPYTDFENGVARPVLPDWIDEYVENLESLRSLRELWIRVRTNLRDGTLAQIDRERERLENEEASQESLQNLLRGLNLG